jgi:hypothetical protein
MIASHKFRYGELLIALLFLLPLFFINIRNTHDWGGDFAQYIHQAKNIVTGIPQYENGYLFNEKYPVLAPRAYSSGFPLLLAPITAIMGTNMVAYNYFNTFLLILFGVCCFIFFRKNNTLMASLSSLLIILYTPWILTFKTEILSDIAFSLFFMLAVIIYQKENKTRSSYIALGMVAGYLLLIRNVGMAVILAIILNETLQLYKLKKNKIPALKNGAVFLGTTLLFYLLVSKLIFPLPTENIHHFYRLFFDTSSIYTTVLTNIGVYMELLENVFQTRTDEWKFLSLYTRSAIITLFVLGFIFKVSKKIEFIEILTFIYLAIIVAWPYSDQGFRFLLPVLPLIFYYVIIAFQPFKPENKLFSNRWLPLGLTFLMLFQFTPSILNIIKTQHQPIPGPYEAESKEAFSYLIKNTSKDSRILFTKPTVLALYTDRKSFANHPSESLEEIAQDISTNNLSHILIQEEISDEIIKKYVAQSNNVCKLLWQNKKFRFYQIM